MIPPALLRAERIVSDVQNTPHVAPLNAARDGAARRPYLIRKNTIGQTVSLPFIRKPA
jgi:hypothetical protein